MSQLSHYRHRRGMRARRGVSNVLTIVVQLPLLFLICATCIELNSMLTTQLGLRYSAAVTVRSAIVWLPAEGPIEERLERIRIAANSSFAPYATGRDVHASAVPSDSGSLQIANEFEQAFAEFAETPPTTNLLSNKMKFARAAMRIEIEVYARYSKERKKKTIRSASGHVVVHYRGRRNGQTNDPDNPDIDVHVSYEKPIDIPGVGVFLGGTSSMPGAPFYSKWFHASCPMTIEGVKSKNHSLGVKYDVFQ